MAGIYIQGLKMPADGELLCVEIHPDGKVSYHLDLKSREIAKAVPVPDHGRLVEADALALRMKPVPFAMETDAIGTWGEIWAEECREISEMPTVIPEDRGDK